MIRHWSSHDFVFVDAIFASAASSVVSLAMLGDRSDDCNESLCGLD
jgi:hypothetical protein